MTADQIRSLQPALAALLKRFRCCFKKEVMFQHWQCYLLGLIVARHPKTGEIKYLVSNALGNATLKAMMTAALILFSSSRTLPGHA